MTTDRQELNAGLRHHRQGELARATEVYERILRRAPEHADALHLLGVVALQRGDHTRAIELITRAIAISPSESAYHCNLGEAFRLTGQLQRAMGCFRTAQAVDAECADAFNGLGLILAVQGQPEAAIEQYRAALELNREFALAHVNLGNVLIHQGQADEALVQFRRAVELNPGLAVARSNLGQLLLERRQIDDALRHCEEAIRLKPGLAEAQNNLGNVYRALGRLTEAKGCYTEALRLNPDTAMIYNNLGQALQEEGRLDEAVKWYQQALRREPESPRFHSNIASAMEEQDDYDGAVDHYQHAVRLNPSHAEAHQGLGFIHHEQGRFDEAAEYYRKALTLKPALAEAHHSLGKIAEELGDFAEAESRFRESLRLDSRSAAAYSALATLLRRRLPEADLAGMKEMLATPGLGDARRCALHLGLAQVCDDRGEYAEAAEHLRVGKALDLAGRQRRNRAYHPDAHTRFVDQVIGAFTPQFFAKVRDWGLESERPVFIFGLPRSGTTLIEQILASHSAVHGAGELRFARGSFEGLAGPLSPGRGKRKEAESNAFTALGKLTGEAVQRVGNHHLEQLAGLNATAARVTDKMPDNYLFLGLLAALFPKAKFVYVRRDLRDIAVSCWITHFRQINWASDPTHIATRFREHRRVMRHWEVVCPVPVLTLDYEDAVADTEGVARRLVGWCGLSWEDACLNFHETVRPVRTASVTQVRQPIYTKSVARWKRYSDSLGPLFEELAELM